MSDSDRFHCNTKSDFLQNYHTHRCTTSFDVAVLTGFLLVQKEYSKYQYRYLMVISISVHPNIKDFVLLSLLLFACVCRAEKTSKLQTIPGTLDIAVDNIPLEHPSTFTCASLVTLPLVLLVLPVMSVAFPLF